MEKKKDIEKAHAIAAIRTETEATVARAQADREEFLALYTKVSSSKVSLL